MNLERRCRNYRAFYPHLGRLAFCGVPWSIIDTLLGQIEEPTWPAWHAACETMAHARHPQSIPHAAALLHFAQFKETERPARKASLQSQVRTLFPHVVAESPWRANALAVPTARGTYPAWCIERTNKNATPRVMILLNGLDSAKEIELWHFANGFLRAGIDACVLLDGPGQGEARAAHPLHRAEFTPLVESAARLLRARFGRQCDITLFGVSFGGYLANHLATQTDAMARALCFSCGTDWAHLGTLPADVQALFAYAAAVAPQEIVAWAAEQLGAPNRAPRMPVRIDHGTCDRIMPVEACRRLAAQYPAQVQLHEYADGHVFLHHVSEVITDAAHWILGREALCANV